MTPPAGRAITRRQKLEVVGRLYDAWLTQPELRLGQLLFNATGGLDIFFVEDYVLLGEVEKLILDIEAASALLHRR